MLVSGGHPTPVASLPTPPPVTAAVTYWLLLKVFASGCTALTGVEAVSNGVKAFREPGVKNAQRTLTVIISCWRYFWREFLISSKFTASSPPIRGQPVYQSVLSMLFETPFSVERFLLCNDRLDSAHRPIAFREHRVCGFSPPVRAISKITARLQLPRSPAGLYLRNHGAGCALRRPSDSFWRCHRIFDPLYAVGAFLAFATFAIRHGGSSGFGKTAQAGVRACSSMDWARSSQELRCV